MTGHLHGVSMTSRSTPLPGKERPAFLPSAKSGHDRVGITRRGEST